eukprot:TRINITY_DN5056_c0_g1_i1.p1 TRINITY_DN5056_c0_g1~~TRINITY_DN5056_c0_g1_i1.p1  ORF type:complete len:356 (+),score=75.20 TRINITY_DN5056_c0_g1_i1:31-1098(+)
MEDQIPPLLRAVGSENGRKLLQLAKLKRAKKTSPDGEAPDFVPSPPIDWIVDVTFPKRKPVLDDTIVKCCDELLKDIPMDITIFGFAADFEQWVPLSFYHTKHVGDIPTPMDSDNENASGSDGDFEDMDGDNEPVKFAKLRFAVKVIDSGEYTTELATPQDLAEVFTLVTSVARQLGGTSEVAIRPEDAAAAANSLAVMYDTCDQELCVVLRSEGTMFPGTLVWDALLSLGCEYEADDKLFLLKDNDGDTLFIINTTIPPRGHLTVEDLSSSEPRIPDLNFSMKIPIWLDPTAVFYVMMRGIRYCQKRLGGGAIVTEAGEPFADLEGAARIRKVEATLKTQGLKCGDDAVLVLFD